MSGGEREREREGFRAMNTGLSTRQEYECSTVYTTVHVLLVEGGSLSLSLTVAAVGDWLLRLASRAARTGSVSVWTCVRNTVERESNAVRQPTLQYSVLSARANAA